MTVLDESTSILGRSVPVNAVMVQAVLCVGFVIEAAHFSAFPASFKVLEEQLGFSVQDLAVISTYEKLALAVSVIFWGMIADKVPKFNILTIAAALWTLTTLCMASVQTYWQLFALRLFCGMIGGCMGPLSSVIIGSLVARHDRGKAFGFALFSVQLGTILGQTTLISFEHVAGPFGMQGWRITFLAIAVLCAAFTVFIACIAMSDQEAPLNRSSIVSTSAKADLFKVLCIPSVAIICLQGMFRNSSVQILQFTAMWIQYQGFDDQTSAWINDARLVGWMFGCLVAGFAADSVSKFHGDWSRIAFGQAGDVLRITFVFLTFGLIPAMMGSALVTSAGMIPLVVALFFLGLAQPWAYIGMVRPMLTEVVHPSLWGLTFAVVQLFEHVTGALVSGPAVALMTAAFGYVEVDDMSQMSAETQASNGAALGKCILWSVTGCQILMLGAISLLYRTYEADRNAAECEKLSDIK